MNLPPIAATTVGRLRRAQPAAGRRRIGPIPAPRWAEVGWTWAAFDYQLVGAQQLRVQGRCEREPEERGVTGSVALRWASPVRMRHTELCLTTA